MPVMTGAIESATLTMTASVDVPLAFVSLTVSVIECVPRPNDVVTLRPDSEPKGPDHV